jgi:hypothetical protein
MTTVETGSLKIKLVICYACHKAVPDTQLRIAKPRAFCKICIPEVKEQKADEPKRCVWCYEALCSCTSGKSCKSVTCQHPVSCRSVTCHEYLCGSCAKYYKCKKCQQYYCSSHGYQAVRCCDTCDCQSKSVF